MKLTPAQLKEFDEHGYSFFPNCFSEEEIALLRDDDALVVYARAHKVAAE